jgi:putative salt-induced outer membrane protein YdiY
MTGAARRAFRAGAVGVAALLVSAVLAVPWAAPRAAAQVNTESFRGVAGQDGVTGSVELSFANTTGNTDLLELGAGARVGWRTGRRTTLFVTDLSVGKARDATTINKGFAHLREVYRITPRFAWEGFVQHEYDKFAHLSARSLVGTGPRLTLVDRAAVSAHLGLAWMLERERLDLPAGAPDPRTDHVHRASSYLAVEGRVNDRLSLINTVYVQPRLFNAADTRVLEEAALKVALAGALSLKVTFSLRYDGEPPTGVKPVDTELDNRLVWEF